MKLILALVGIWLGCLLTGLFVGGAIGLLAGMLDIPHPDGPGDGIGIMLACVIRATLGITAGGFVANKIAAKYSKKSCRVPVNSTSDDEVWPPTPTR